MATCFVCFGLIGESSFYTVMFAYLCLNVMIGSGIIISKVLYVKNPDDEPEVDLDLLKAEDNPGDSLAVRKLF